MAQVPAPPIAARLDRRSLPVIAAIFLVVFAILITAVNYAGALGALDVLMLWTAKGAHALMAAVGLPAQLDQRDIALTHHILRIDLDCTAIAIFTLYSSLIIAYPLSIKTRVTAVAAGLPVLIVANLLRLLGVALASEYLSADAFYFAHDYLFKAVMVLVVIAMWSVWLGWARRHAAQR